MTDLTPQQKRKKEWQFVFNAIVLAILMLAVMHSFRPYIGKTMRLEEVKELESQIVSLSPSELPPYLKMHNKGKPVMLVLYASWCGYCRTQMPDVVALVKDGKLSHFTPMFMALDDQPRDLSKYLVYNDFHKVFRPYRVSQSIIDRLPPAMQLTGSGYKGQIPYIGFFGLDGKVVAEHFGVVDKQTLLETAAKLKKL